MLRQTGCVSYDSGDLLDGGRAEAKLNANHYHADVQAIQTTLSDDARRIFSRDGSRTFQQWMSRKS